MLALVRSVCCGRRAPQLDMRFSAEGDPVQCAHFDFGGAMSTVVLTGFPGFLASAFVPNLLSRLDADTSVTCLIQSHYRPLAEQRRNEIAAANPAWKDRIRLLEGDITKIGLGLPPAEKDLQRQTREVYHFAALYDLALPRPLGMKINVDGTVNVLDFIGGCSNFRRLHYISTCYVSGRHPGNFTENDLICGQRFNNYYEETKYLAEVEVQERMKRGLAATIYRPAIVVGDSKTGATQKFDGPYGALRWVLRSKRTATLVTVGDPTKIPRQPRPQGLCGRGDQPVECPRRFGRRGFTSFAIRGRRPWPSCTRFSAR